MNPRTTWKGGLIGLLACLPLTGACATQKALQDYQDEVRALREERTSLKKENRGLKMQIESYEVALAEATSKIEQAPEGQRYAELDELGIQYGNRGGDFVVSIPAEVTFGSGKADLTASGKKALDAVARMLAADHSTGLYWIEGHTDIDPIKKSSWGSNRELSIARAMAVLHYLVEDVGVPDEQCSVVGHGQYRPVADNESGESKAKNRRVEIVVRGEQRE